VILKGETPNPVDIPSGCRFHPRCPDAIDVCKETDPPSKLIGGDHYASCLRIGE
jgi:oligopeptide/dipeptide ABC transporter ATP-binding protein